MFPFKTCKRFFSLVDNEKGTTIITSLLFAGIASGIVLTVGNLFLQQQALMTDLNTKLSLTIIRSNFTAMINDDAAWAKTLEHTTNQSLQCLREGTSCASALNGINPIPVIMASDGTVFYDSQDESKGVSSSGAPCDTFKTSGYNPQCPYRAEVSWRPICTGACVNPQIQVTVLFFHQRSSGRSVAVNTENFTVEILK